MGTRERRLIPPPLQARIDAIVGRVERQQLERAAQTLSERYRAGGTDGSRAARTATDVAAYLAVRAPATYAAVEDTLARIRAARPGWGPESVLDLGAGPGVASWAVAEAWPTVAGFTLVEAEPAMAAAGREIAASASSGLQRATWLEPARVRLRRPAELVIASYLLGELPERELAGFAAEAWEQAIDTLIVLEPGTTAGYRRVLAVRDVVIRAGGHTLAPCPHDAACPLPADDWCHFAVRLSRTRLHREAKGAELGFEDEKFAYAVLTRSQHARPAARVLRRPDLRPGHVVLALCTEAGLEQRTVSRKDGPAYRQARKLRWGDALE